MSFYERYERCCKEKGILPASQAAAEALGCTRSNISAFAKGEYTPNGDIVANAAKMLDVSADYLLGLIDVAKPIDPNLSEEQCAFLRLIEEIEPANRDAATAMLKGLAKMDADKSIDFS